MRIGTCGIVILFWVSLMTGYTEELSGGTDVPSFDMEEMVVTATPTEHKVADLTSAVNVIDELEIEHSNADYVMDVIGSLPGVYIRRDAIYGRQDVEIRGLGSNCRRILTLVDGRPEKMSLFSCTVAQTLPLSNVERIEVIRGPESVLYGTDAMGGVVNIITRRKLEPGFESTAQLSYGSYETLHGLLRHGGNVGDFDYYATYDRKQTDGYRDNSDYEADFLSLRMGYQINEVWRFELAGQYFSDDAEDPGPENDPYTNHDKREYTRYSWDADLIGTWEDAALRLTIYDNEGDHEFNMPSIEDYWHSKDQTFGVLSRYSRTVYEQRDITDTLSVGYEYKYQWAEPQDDWVTWAKANMPARFMDFGPYRRNNHDVFAFNEFIKGRWVQTLGMRGHWDDEDETWQAIPQIGLLCHMTEAATARAKIGKGFRQPSFSELHLFPAHNTKLDPEKVWSYEMALTYRFTPGLSVFINPFYMDVDNLIQQEAYNNPPPQFLNVNSGSFDIRGVETGFDLQLIEDLDLTMHYTYTDIDDGPAGNPDINREGKPEHVVNAVMTYRIGAASLSLESEYVAGLYDSNLLAGGDIEKVDDFIVFDLKGSYQLSDYVQLFAGIDNLFDEDYEQIPGYPMPGTMGFAGLKMQM